MTESGLLWSSFNARIGFKDYTNDLVPALQILLAFYLLLFNNYRKKTSPNLAINASDFNLGRVDKVYKIVTEFMTLFIVTKPSTPP